MRLVFNSGILINQHPESSAGPSALAFYKKTYCNPSELFYHAMSAQHVTDLGVSFKRCAVVQ